MHAVWDSVLYEYTGYPDLPFSNSDWDWYTNEAASLASTYPIDDLKLDDADFNGWATESLDMAETEVYPGKYY